MDRAKALTGAVPPDGVAVAEEALSREARRSRRKREVRAVTISTKRMTKQELELGRAMYPERDYWRPGTRAECVDGPRPCPYVACRYHLFIDVSPRTGAIKLNFPDLETDELAESCCLDVADRGGETLENVGAIMNFTRERCRQIEVKAFARLELLEEARQQVEGEQRQRVRTHLRLVEEEA